jgi:UDP-N-acetylmuramoyl-tripeptide--D-alanyl-D-alanine ligase
MPSYRQLSSLRRWIRFCKRVLLLSPAALWRLLMFRTTFIAITGSVGKTTAKECAAAALRFQNSVIWTKGNSNHYNGLAKTLLRVRPWHRFAVVEVGIDGPGQMRLFGRLVRPKIAVWLGVARTHTDMLHSLETTAAEKSQLIDSLPSGGIAVINADDPYVAQYTPPQRVKTIRFGTGEGCDLRGTDIRSAWPDRLSLRLLAHGEEVAVTTRLVGTHWAPSVLAAFAVAKACGMELREAAAGVARAEPMLGRMFPAKLPSGAVILRDEYNGSVDTLAPALRVMEEARAMRKVLVISNVSDDKRKLRRRFAGFGRSAAQLFDAAVFLGEYSPHARKVALEAGVPPESVHSFMHLEEAAEFLKQDVRDGDLVLLRGANSDHLSRLCLAFTGKVECWRNRCPKRGLCDTCSYLRRKPGTFGRLMMRLQGI